METLDYIGKVLPAGLGRDAIHIAVYPMLAQKTMHAGERVEELGIVDPFLTRAVNVGERFFVFLTPQSIRSQRHVWSHPEIPDEGPTDLRQSAERVDESRKWLAAFASKLGPFSADDLIETTRFYVEGRSQYGNDSICMSSDLDNYELEPTAEFWGHYEVATGTRTIAEKRPTYFRCAC